MRNTEILWSFPSLEPYLIIEPLPAVEMFQISLRNGRSWRRVIIARNVCTPPDIVERKKWRGKSRRRGSVRPLVPTSRQFYTRRTTVPDGGMKDVCKFNRLGRWKILCIPERAAWGTFPSSWLPLSLFETRHFLDLIWRDDELKITKRLSRDDFVHFLERVARSLIKIFYSLIYVKSRTCLLFENWNKSWWVMILKSE